jgi:cytochrome c oxidase subunit 2
MNSNSGPANKTGESQMQPRNRLQDWHHLLIMCLVLLLLSGGLAYLFLHIDFIPHPASTERGMIDAFVKLLFGIAAVFFVVVITVFAYSLLFFRRRRGDNTDGAPIRGNAALEVVWTLIPLVVVVALGTYGAFVLNKMTVPPPVSDTAQSELQVNVLAFRFGWQFTYPSYDITSFELELPVNQPVLFQIQSKDVVHSFWVQEFGPKQDAVPGLTTELRVNPTEIGDFQVRCSQLCGYGHTLMVAPVHVVSASDFQSWVQQQQKSQTPTPSPTPSPTPTTTPTPGQSVTIQLTAHNIAFNLSTITVPPGAQVTVDFNNEDSSVPHNFSVYDSPAAQKVIFQGKIITGPATTTYTFTAPATPGTYFFRCDVHPTIMTGSFIVK